MRTANESKDKFTLAKLCMNLAYDPDAAMETLKLGTYTFENNDTIAYCCILPFSESLDAPGPQWPQDYQAPSHNAWFHLIASNRPVNIRAIIRHTLKDGRFLFPLNVYARPVNGRLYKVVTRLYGAKAVPDYPHICHAMIASPAAL